MKQYKKNIMKNLIKGNQWIKISNDIETVPAWVPAGEIFKTTFKVCAKVDGVNTCLKFNWKGKGIKHDWKIIV